MRDMSQAQSQPCSSCAKANTQCIYRPPPRPRRRKREHDAGGSASRDGDKSRRVGTGEAPLNECEDSRLPSGPDPIVPEPQKCGSGRMIMKDGNSVYLDKSVMSLEHV
jgi:hypothetical protein